MNDTISMQEVRRDLPGFLRRIASGHKLTVIYHSVPVVTVQSAPDTPDGLSPEQNIHEFLSIAAKARASAKHILDPSKSYKQLYTETETTKHGIS